MTAETLPGRSAVAVFSQERQTGNVEQDNVPVQAGVTMNLTKGRSQILQSFRVQRLLIFVDF
ncbi:MULTISPECIES: hypothetical protein [unclassified Streptomyces]|uniref:hypothetical protein n=1 Tax=unclassified Streptomyces TaxID=2593676 RepID=UPI00114C8E30|nr:MULTISPECIES: hypothetical protein [unclassified Streptomyces]MYZ34492.1 hypothetical protein [Streptomyces sp. SID4917]